MSTTLPLKTDYTTAFTLPLDAPDGDMPNFTVEAYDKMLKAWMLVNDVYAGTFRIRAKGKDYIPKFPMESEESHKARIAVAVLMNVYARTVDAMTGLVIGSGLKVEKVPAAMADHLKNIDNAGTEFEVFARELLRDAFIGHCVVLIDMPDVPEGERPKNKTEERKANLRPYWTRKRPEDILNWRTEVTPNGETVISQITFCEVVSVPEGEFGEKHETRYLVWYLRKTETGEPIAAFKKYVEYEEEVKRRGVATKKVKRFRIIASGDTHMSRIPIFVVYGEQTDGRVLESQPPLLDLAHKNIEHLQIDSDYKKGLAIAGIALPVLKTDSPVDELEQRNFAWDQFVVVGKDEDFKWEEANGEALPNKKIAIDDIKREMGVLGLSLIAERSDANITATERLLDSVQQSNQLMNIQASLLQGLRKGIEIHAAWMKIDAKDVAVSLGLDWTELVRSETHMRLLLEMAQEDFLSTLTLLESAGRYGVLPSYVNAEEEISRLKTEGRVRRSRIAMKSTATGLETTGGVAGATATDPESASDTESTDPTKGGDE